MAKKIKAGWSQPTLEGFLQRRNQSLSDFIAREEIVSIEHLHSVCDDLGLTPPKSLSWDTPWHGKLPNALVQLPEKKVEPTSAPPKKKKKEEGSGVRTSLVEAQEESKDADS